MERPPPSKRLYASSSLAGSAIYFLVKSSYHLTMKFIITPEQIESMIEEPDKIYTYHSYDIRGFEYNFKGTPSEYKADKEKRLIAYREEQIACAKFYS